MPSFPPEPVSTIDWNNVGFKVREVNGHIESTYSKATGQWSPLRWVTSPYMRIHGMAPALNYGVQAYEGLKAFRDPTSAVSVFRPDRNARRMQHSAAVVSVPPVPVETFLRGVRAAVALNAAYVPPHETGAAMYVRPQVYGSSAQLGLSPPDEFTFAVFVMPTGVFHGLHPVKALILDDFDRAAPHGTGDAKVGGNYGPVLRWSDRAREAGYGITLHLDSARHEEIDEFSTSAFIGVQYDGDLESSSSGSGVTLVVPDSKCAIDSVTSDSIQHIARSFGWSVEKRPVKYTELPSFTEVMAAGTAAALVPIRSITRRSSQQLPAGPRVSASAAAEGEAETVTYIADAQEDAGPACVKLLTKLKGIQQGKVEDEFGWRCVLGEEDTKGIEGVEEEAAGGRNGDAQTVDQMD